MTTPEDALERARAAAASMRAAGAYGDAPHGSAGPPAGEVDDSKLSQWALIDPDVRNVRSTRRLGAPVTLLKRALLRLLAQYHHELIAEQTRFNAVLVDYIRRLEQRVAELERRLDDRDGRR